MKRRIRRKIILRSRDRIDPDPDPDPLDPVELVVEEYDNDPEHEREAFKTALEKGSVEVAYARVMFLGPGGAGKSSLKKGLMGQRFNAKEKSTVIADYQQVRPVHREWVREGSLWDQVTEEDEIEELAQLLALANQPGRYTQDELSLISSEASSHHQTSFLREVQEITNNKVIDAAIKRSIRLSPEHIHLQPFLHLWDCGGQPVFLEVLPAFLTSRTMFLLVFDASKSLEKKMLSLHYEEGRKVHHGMTNTTTLQLMKKWITNIHACLVETDEHGVPQEYPRINVVGTRGDKLSSDKKSKIDRQLQEQFDQCLFDEIVEDYMIIDNTTSGKKNEDENFEHLRERVHKFVTKNMKEETPVSWTLFRKVLQFLVTNRSCNTLPFEDVSSIAVRACNMKLTDVVPALRFYHELGVLLYYPCIDGLKEKVILDPRWFVERLGKVLTLPGCGVVGGRRSRMKNVWDIFQSKGILVEPLYSEAWKDCQEITPDEMINLLVVFHLAAEIKTDKDGYQREGVKKYFVPCVLRYKPEPKQPFFSRILGTNRLSATCEVAPVHITFKTDYVLPGFFIRLVAVMAESPLCSLYFNDGVYHDFVKYDFGNPPVATVSLTDITHAIQINVASTINNSHARLQENCANLLELIPKLCQKVEDCLRPNGFAGFEDRGISVSKVKRELQIVCQSEKCQAFKPHYLIGTPSENGEIYCENRGRTETSRKSRQLLNSEKYWFLENGGSVTISHSPAIDLDMSDSCPGQMSPQASHLLSLPVPQATGSKPTLFQVTDLLKTKSANWFEIGQALGVDHNFRQGLLTLMIPPLAKLESVLDKWISSECSEVSWQHFHDIVNQIGYTNITREQCQHNHEILGVQAPASFSARPTVPELCFDLRDLVDWEKTVIQLPAMNNAEVKKVKRNEPDVDQQKQEAFDTWLKRCPEASWSHVRAALHKAGEFNLEKMVATKHCLPLQAEYSQTNAATENVVATTTSHWSKPQSIPPSPARPTVPELCFELRALDDWKKTVLYLPGMISTEVNKVQYQPNLALQREEAFDTWLTRCPEASWSHVRAALHKAGEFNLEKKVSTKHCLPSLARYPTLKEVSTSQTNVVTGIIIDDGHHPNLAHHLPPILDPPPGSVPKQGPRPAQLPTSLPGLQPASHAVKPAEDTDNSILSPDSNGTTLLAVYRATSSIHDWSILALLIGVSEDDYQRIKQGNSTAAEQQKAIIQKWLDSGRASWATLASALRDDLVSKAAVGNKIAQDHPSRY